METSKISIAVPDYWKRPKYSLGQRIKQGIIVGIQYRLPDDSLAECSEGYWHYIVRVSATRAPVQ
ncbi:MAG: hypothetical protein MET45_29920 [Nostoc sp. LLA-1]|nr:hypothetical protein [Cyanocohniella sp. LLY]